MPSTVPDEPAPVAGGVAYGSHIGAEPARRHDDAATAGATSPLAPHELASYDAQRRELLEAIRTPIITTDLAGRITNFNAAAVALFGSPARLYGRVIREVLPFAAAPGEAGGPDAQGRLSDANGRSVDLEVSRTLSRGADGRGYGIYVVHDISRHAEVNRLREQLLYSVAHELRGPLMVLDNAVEMLESDSDKLTTEEFVHVLGTARRSAQRMRTLMEDMLSAGSIQSGHFVVAPRRNELPAIVDDALDIVLPQMTSRSQQLVVDIPEESRWVLADKRYARQVLTNLLSNASKYSPEGSLIGLSAELTAAMVRISVVDRGPGIAPEQQVGLFERFYRVRMESDAPGVGLGLAIAKGIVEAHSGTIGVESAPGAGTRVWFTLPSADRQEDGRRSADPAR
ncbi:MAG: hypothetical protein NVSMB2_16820 [Chloroflexota bacterium]